MTGGNIIINMCHPAGSGAAAGPWELIQRTVVSSPVAQVGITFNPADYDAIQCFMTGAAINHTSGDDVMRLNLTDYGDLDEIAGTGGAVAFFAADSLLGIDPVTDTIWLNSWGGTSNTSAVEQYADSVTLSNPATLKWVGVDGGGAQNITAGTFTFLGLPS